MRQFKNIESAGYPVDGGTFLEINSQIQQVADFAAAANGDNYISSGVELLQNNEYSDGWIVWNGEILPFQGGAHNAQVTIVEEDIDVTYQDNTSKGHVQNRYAKFGNDGVETFDFSALKPAYTKFATNFLQKVALPFAGDLADMPKGFQLADGTNDTPDMRSAFVVGYNPNEADYNTIGNTGGAKEVALTEAQMASHSHGATTDSQGDHTHGISVSVIGNPDGGGDTHAGEQYWNTRHAHTTKNTNSAGLHSHGVSIDSTGSGESHENRPPYYVVAYMMWVGF